jgi:glycosyltransferase involved in cell wall biosynthesis
LDYISRNYGFYANNVYILPNGVDRKIFKPRQIDKSLLSKLNISSDEHVVGWVGNIRPEKDIETFIRACEKVLDIKKNVKFLVIGEDRGKESLLEKLSKRCLSDEFIITGKVFNIEKYYNIMDVFVLSSLSEGMPNALIEAQSSGIPAIATDVPGVDEIVIDEKTGYIVEKRAYEEIADRVLFLLNNDDIRKRMGILASNSIPDKFEMGKMIKYYENFYLKAYNKR